MIPPTVHVHLFKLHAVPIGDLDSLADGDEASAGAQQGNAVLGFYRGETPIELRPLPSADQASHGHGRDDAIIPLNVMQFHTVMLPPNTTCGIGTDSGPPEASFDRLADAEHVELFGHNVVLPSVSRLRQIWASTSRDDIHALNIHSLEETPHMIMLFPSVIERNISVQQWKGLIRDGPMLDRMHYSYTILLHYFGWRLHNEETGEVDRHQNWRIRYSSLEGIGDSVAEADKFAHSPTDCYAIWTRMLRVLLELRMPNYVGQWLRFLLDEFRSDRLLFLLPVWDTVWFPYVGDGKMIFQDTIEMLRKRRRRIDVTTSSDEDELLFGSAAE